MQPPFISFPSCTLVTNPAVSSPYRGRPNPLIQVGWPLYPEPGAIHHQSYHVQDYRQANQAPVDLAQQLDELAGDPYMINCTGGDIRLMGACLRCRDAGLSVQECRQQIRRTITSRPSRRLPRRRRRTFLSRLLGGF